MRGFHSEQASRVKGDRDARRLEDVGQSSGHDRALGQLVRPPRSQSKIMKIPNYIKESRNAVRE